MNPLSFGRVKIPGIHNVYAMYMASLSIKYTQLHCLSFCSDKRVRCIWVKWSEILSNRVSLIVRTYIHHMNFAAFMALGYITFLCFNLLSIYICFKFNFVSYIVWLLYLFILIIMFIYFYCYIYEFFVIFMYSYYYNVWIYIYIYHYVIYS